MLAIYSGVLFGSLASTFTPPCNSGMRVAAFFNLDARLMVGIDVDQ